MSKTQNDIDQTFMDVAELIAGRCATCLRLKTAAIIAIDREPVTWGYNGAPSGVVECEERGECVVINGHCALCNHAEENAIINAAKHGKTIKGATLYTLVEPCLSCTRSIINADFRRVVWRQDYFAEGRGHESERILVEEMRQVTDIVWERLRQS